MSPLKLIIISPSRRKKFQREIISEMVGNENMRQSPGDSVSLDEIDDGIWNVYFSLRPVSVMAWRNLSASAGFRSSVHSS
jgi:hypothetical protein